MKLNKLILSLLLSFSIGSINAQTYVQQWETWQSPIFSVISSTNYNGNIKFRNTLRTWVAGMLGSVGSQKFQIYDSALNAIRFTIDESGYIGLGIANPSTNAHIYSDNRNPFFSAGASGFLVGIGGINHGISLWENAGSANSYIGNQFDDPSVYTSIIGRSSSSTNAINIATFKNNGNVGIGTTTPSAKLDIGSGGNSQFSSGLSVRGQSITNSTNNIEWGHANNAGYGSTIGHYSISGNPYIAFNGEAGTNSNTFRTRGKIASIILSDLYGGLQFGNVGTANGDNQEFVPLFTLQNTGNVGIGTTSLSEKLSVNGNIKANGNIIVKKVIVTQSGWPDYVFSKEHKLRSLNSLEAYINQNKHLPDVPSAKEVADKGLSVGDNQALLLKKIEELTLYLIQQDKKIEVLQQKSRAQEKQIQQQLEKIQKRNKQ